MNEGINERTNKDKFYPHSYKVFATQQRGGSEVKASASNAGDLGSINGLGRSPGEGNGNPLQYSCLDNPMEGGAWQATVRGVEKSDRTERLHFHFQRENHASEKYNREKKEYIKAVYCHSAYLTYMQSTSCEMPGQMTHIGNQDCWEKYQQPKICR